MSTLIEGWGKTDRFERCAEVLSDIQAPALHSRKLKKVLSGLYWSGEVTGVMIPAHHMRFSFNTCVSRSSWSSKKPSSKFCGS